MTMLIRETTYNVKCDGCGYVNSDFWQFEPGFAVSRAEDVEGWLTRDGNHYCPKCMKRLGYDYDD